MAKRERPLDGLRVAILATDGFEQVELTGPRRALEQAGADTLLVAPEDGTIRGWNHSEWGDELDVDLPLADADPDDFDALLLPGGVMNPDHLRTEPEAIGFVKAFFESSKPVAAICHAPWMLVEADVVRDREVTSWRSLRTDLENAGARWSDREVVIDGTLVTSRDPDDLPAFERAIVDAFSRSGAPQRR